MGAFSTGLTMIRDYSRYIVFKRSDIFNCLNAIELDMLMHIGFKLEAYRLSKGKESLKAVVIEHDWPEFEKVWNMLEDRVKNESIIHG